MPPLSDHRLLRKDLLREAAPLLWGHSIRDSVMITVAPEEFKPPLLISHKPLHGLLMYGDSFPRLTDCPHRPHCMYPQKLGHVQRTRT